MTAGDVTAPSTSLSARRAWIEIYLGRTWHRQNVVALRKESVDRNRIDRSQLWVDWRSLSARRAWIEIPIAAFLLMWWQVALRKESVDRNCADLRLVPPLNASLSARRAWIEIGMLANWYGNSLGRSPQGERG